jgi:hypothetical protein
VDSETAIGHDGPDRAAIRARMLIHFEIRGEKRWEALGTGESSGDVDPLQDAIDDLRSLHGGKLPTGSYRYMAAIGDDPRWEEFDLGAAGDAVFRFKA